MAHIAKANPSAVKRRRETAERLRGIFVHVATGASLVDELIADRRAESGRKRTEAEWRNAGN